MGSRWYGYFVSGRGPSGMQWYVCKACEKPDVTISTKNRSFGLTRHRKKAAEWRRDEAAYVSRLLEEKSKEVGIIFGVWRDGHRLHGGYEPWSPSPHTRF
jgi:hypothetical protein